MFSPERRKEWKKHSARRVTVQEERRVEIKVDELSATKRYFTILPHYLSLFFPFSLINSPPQLIFSSRSSDLSSTNKVLDKLASQGIAIRVASPKLVMEEAPESYKDVTQVVDTCHNAGISNKCIKLRPIAVIKG